jgi:hypothetical protein
VPLILFDKVSGGRLGLKQTPTAGLSSIAATAALSERAGRPAARDRPTGPGADPGLVSVRRIAGRAQYYAHPRNRSGDAGRRDRQPLKDMREAAGIAIWTSTLPASVPAASIRYATPSPTILPHCGAYGAYANAAPPKRLREMEALGYEAVVLPSTSPAHAGMTFEEKLARWREALQA